MRTLVLIFLVGLTLILADKAMTGGRYLTGVRMMLRQIALAFGWY